MEKTLNASEKATTFKVVGYYPDWEGEKLNRLQLDVLTNIIYAFAIPQSDGTIKPLDHPETAKKLISMAHKSNVKVSVAVGGWSYLDIPLEPAFREATDSDEKIASFVASIMKLIHQYGFDGVDLDWEHPKFGDISQIQYEKLMITLSKELKKENLILTSAVLGGVSGEGTLEKDAEAQTQAVIDCVDWFNVMAYDGGEGEKHSSYDFAVNCGSYWKNTRGMHTSKIVLGVPFYGRPTWSTYDVILQSNPNAHLTDITDINGVEVHYNGLDTIQKKAKWAKENVGGIMVWELSHDTLDQDKSLLCAIGKVFK